MNNKTLAWVITALVAALAVILVIVCTKLDTFVEPFDGINHWWEISSESESESETESESEESISSEESESVSDDIEESKPSGNGTNTGNNNQPSSESSSVINISGNGSSSRPSSGNHSSGSSSESSSSENSSTSSSTSSSTGLPSGSGPSEEIGYEEYMAMSGDEQYKYMMSFPSMEAYFDWYNAAKAKYDAEHPSIEIGGDGSIDLGEIIGGQNP